VDDAVGTCIAFSLARKSAADDDAAEYDADVGDTGGTPAAEPGARVAPVFRRKAGSSGVTGGAAAPVAAGAAGDSDSEANVAWKVDRASSTGRLFRPLSVVLPDPVVLLGFGVAADAEAPARDVLRNGGNSGAGGAEDGGVDDGLLDSPGMDRAASADENAARASSTGLCPAPFVGSGRFISSPDNPGTLPPAIVTPFLLPTIDCQPGQLAGNTTAISLR